jgi:predicted Holliday junction resolvase-like endonuclease
MDVEIIVILLVAVFFAIAVGFILGRKFTIKEYAFKFEEWIKENTERIRREAIKKSREVLGGKFSEQLAPFLPDFKYDPTESRFIGTPIDLLIFKGLSSGNPEEIVFLEIKTGKSRLSQPERKIKELIEGKKIRWELYQVPEDITKVEEDV